MKHKRSKRKPRFGKSWRSTTGSPWPTRAAWIPRTWRMSPTRCSANGYTWSLADSASVPRAELADAEALARSRGWHIEIIRTEEFSNEAFLRNDERRCYHCKLELFGRIRRYAEAHGLAVVAHGETADDTHDATRTGVVAARELGVAAPLQAAGLVKEEIRLLSERRGLPTWDKASFACLASRLPAGIRIDEAVLSDVERAEDVLKELGFRQYRARHHGDLCRIELEPDDFARAIQDEARRRIVNALTEIGFRHVTLDLAGYRDKKPSGDGLIPEVISRAGRSRWGTCLPMASMTPATSAKTNTKQKMVATTSRTRVIFMVRAPSRFKKNACRRTTWVSPRRPVS